MKKRDFLKLGLKAIAGVAVLPFVSKVEAKKPSLKGLKVEPRFTDNCSWFLKTEPGESEIFWVSQNSKHKGPGDGSKEKPFRYFMEAVDNCSLGDEIIMMPSNSFPRKMKATMLT